MFDYLNETDIGYPAVPGALTAQFESGNPWNLKDGDVQEDGDARAKVKDALLGNIFAISSHLIEREVVSVKDLELGIRTSLAWPKGPFSLMNDLGMEESARLVGLAVEKGYYGMPARFAGGVPEPWDL